MQEAKNTFAIKSQDERLLKDYFNFYAKVFYH